METAIIVTLITAAVGIIGYLFDRKGKREAKAQQDKANELTERQQDWARRGDIIDDLTEQLARKQGEIDGGLVREALLQQENARLRESKQGILNTVHLLQRALHDETAIALAQLEIDKAAIEDRGGQNTHD